MDLSVYLDQAAEACAPPVYPPPVCWGRLAPAKVLAAQKKCGGDPGRIMLKLALPFCASKCCFCDFSAPPEARTVDAYVRALAAEMRRLKGTFAGREFFSLRLEGNAFSPDARQLASLLDAAGSAFRLAPGHKSGVELNPASVTREKARVAAGRGIDWAILGVQSLDPAVLRAAGCPHAGTDLGKKYEILRKAGFRTVSMDLMFGLPGQTAASFIRDVAALVKLRPERIALYRASRFSGSRAELDLVVNKGFGLMEKAGYLFTKDFSPYWGVTDLKLNETWPHAYETGDPASAYSILALGAGARSYLWGAARYQSAKDAGAYIAAVKAGRTPAETGIALSAADEMTGYMLMSFGCMRTLRNSDFERTFGLPLEKAYPAELKALLAARVIRRGADGYEMIKSQDAARHAARRAFFPPELAAVVKKRMTCIKTATY